MLLFAILMDGQIPGAHNLDSILRPLFKCATDWDLTLVVHFLYLTSNTIALGDSIFAQIVLLLCKRG